MKTNPVNILISIGTIQEAREHPDRDSRCYSREAAGIEAER